MGAGRPEALGAQVVDLVVVERRQGLGADDPAEQQVGEARVAGEHGTVQVGADDPAAHHALAAVAVALADLDRRQGGAAGPGHRAPGVVLEAGEHAEVDGGAGRAVGIGDRGLGGEQLADGPGAVDPDGVAVEQAEPGPVGAGGVGEAVAEDLHAGADRQHHRAAVDGAVQGPALGQLAGGLDLRAVLAAADEVEVARVGGGLAGGDGDDVDAEAPPGEALGEHEGVAAVAVGAEQVGEEHAEAHGGLAGALTGALRRGRGTPGRRCSWRPRRRPRRARGRGRRRPGGRPR